MRRPVGIITDAGQFVGKQILNQFAASKNESRVLRSEFTKTNYGADGLVEPLQDPEILAGLVDLNTYHGRAVRTKARDTAGLGWSITAVDEKTEGEPASVKAAKAFLDELDLPLTDVLNQVMVDRESIGWGCFEIVHKNNEPDGELRDITHVPAHTVRIHKNGRKFLQRRGTAKVWFRRAGLVDDADHPIYIDAKTGRESDDSEEDESSRIAPNDRATDLVWLPTYSTRSDYYGSPDILPALAAILGDMSRETYNIAFFANYGVPAYAVFITGNFDPTVPGIPSGDGESDESVPDESIQSIIEEHFAEYQERPHSTMVMALPSSSGDEAATVTFERLSTDVKEASFRLYRADNRDEVLAAHGVPPYRMGIAAMGSLGTNVAAETTEIYKTSVVQPRQETLERSVNRHVLPAFKVEGWRFELAEIDTTDELHELEMLTKLWNVGAVTAAEVRAPFVERFGLDPDVVLPEDLGPDVGEIDKALTEMRARIEKEIADGSDAPGGRGRADPGSNGHARGSRIPASS
ncbi:MAG: phage portal protein [Actinomycetota bacterium]